MNGCWKAFRPIASDTTPERSEWSVRPTGCGSSSKTASAAEGDLLIGADGLHSKIRDIVGARDAEPTGWCSWQGLVTLPDVADKHVALMIIGEHGNLGLWPAGGSDVQWWFDLPWSSGFVRPERPIDMIRSISRDGRDAVDRVLATLTDDDLADSPYPHFRHPIPRVPGQGALTLLGDAAHTMPPTLAQGTNQALLDTMVLCKALSDLRRTNNGGDLSSALRWYEKTRRRKVTAVSRVASLQVSHGESVLKPAAMIPDRFMTWALTNFCVGESPPDIRGDQPGPRGHDELMTR